MTTTRRRDRQGRFVKTCVQLSGCDTMAQWGIEGYGAFGVRHAYKAVWCRKHGLAHVKRMNRARGGGSYKLIKP